MATLTQTHLRSHVAHDIELGSADDPSSSTSSSSNSLPDIPLAKAFSLSLQNPIKEPLFSFDQLALRHLPAAVQQRSRAWDFDYTFSHSSPTKKGRLSKWKRQQLVKWAMVPLMAYNHQVSKRPVFVKAVTCMVGFILGDLLAQLLEQSGLDVLRTCRLAIYGLLIEGPLSHYWYHWLDARIFPGKAKSWGTVILKTLLDEALWAPVITVLAFACIRTLEGNPSQALPTIQEKFLSTLLADLVLWPAAQLLGFRLVPAHFRVLYINVVMVFWNVYLSWAAHN